MARRRLEDEGPDAGWLEEESKRRRALWEHGRPARRRAAREARRSEPLSRRVHRVEVMLALSATAPAAAISGAGGGSGPDSQVPPPAEQSFSGEHPRELRRLLALLEGTIERLERLAESDPQEPLTGTDLDRRLLEEYSEFSDEDAAALEPLFGSAEAVRRTRRTARA
jgi:hypothetical protein